MATGSTRGKRRLARYVQPLCERSGMSSGEIARAARTSRYTVERLLKGDSLLRWSTAANILEVVGATEEEKVRAKRLWEVADVHPTTVEHGRDLPANYRRFRMDEQEAVRERSLDPSVVPGMLQTSAYARAIARSQHRTVMAEGWADRAPRERSERQQLLGCKGFTYHAVLDEPALRRLVGGVEVMQEQFDRLLWAAARPNVVLQVLPYSAGAYAHLSGSMTMLDFPDSDEPRLAYVESLTGLSVVEHDRTLGMLSAVWDDAVALAYSPGDSVEFMRAARDALGDA